MASLQSMNYKMTPKIISHVLLIFGSILFTIPFLWTVSTALKETAQVYLIPPKWIPDPVTFANFKEAWTVLPFFTFLKNTVIITFFSLIGQVFSAALVAYGFARFKFRGRNALFFTMLGTMMLPAQVTMIPTFLIWRDLHLVNTFYPLIVPAYLGGGAFTIFLLRQFFMTIPKDLDEAAMLDGCSYFQIWWRILMPLCKPALITVVIFSFLGSWDDFMGPLIYLHTLEKFTMSVGLNMFQDMFTVRLELLMAAALVHITPCLILFVVAQRYFIKGIVMSGLKA